MIKQVVHLMGVGVGVWNRKVGGAASQQYLYNQALTKIS